MKVSVQEKIAELESRIAVLEKGAKIHSGATRYFTSVGASGKLWEHWERVWKEFDKLMEKAFK